MVSPFLRKVKTASGAMAVQIAVKEGRRDKVIEHLGSAHTQAELAALMEIGRRRIAPDQLALDLSPVPSAPPPASSGPANVGAVVASKRSALLWDVLHGAYTRLGLGEAVGGDRAFEQMVLARLIEPTSKAQVPCVLADLGLESASVRTLFRSLGRCIERDYRQAISAAALKHAMAAGDVSLCLYDVTTLYFETEKEDELRKVGYSKERRVDPQIIVGLLVDRAGFPLRIGCWEGNRAETTTIVGVVEQFRQAAKVEPLVVVADAGMLSAANLNALDEAGVGFIVGSRTTRAPGDLEAHFHWHGDAFTDGQVIKTLTPKRDSRSERDKSRKAEPVWDPGTHPGSWRAIWVHSSKRFPRDNHTLDAQANRARAVIAGDKRPKSTRFVTTHKADQVLDEASLARARRLAGLKGYVTNMPTRLMDAAEVVSSYHELWHARSVLSDEQARPASPPRLPPHPRCHLGPPDDGDGRASRSPIPPRHHRDEHRQDRTRAARPAGGRHQHQRPLHQRRPTTNPQGRRNPHRPQHPNRALKLCNSGWMWSKAASKPTAPTEA